MSFGVIMYTNGDTDQAEDSDHSSSSSWSSSVTLNKSSSKTVEAVCSEHRFFENGENVFTECIDFYAGVDF